MSNNKTALNKAAQLYLECSFVDLTDDPEAALHNARMMAFHAGYEAAEKQFPPDTVPRSEVEALQKQIRERAMRNYSMAEERLKNGFDAASYRRQDHAHACDICSDIIAKLLERYPASAAIGEE